MWKKNTDTGKWVQEVDSLTKDNFDFYKQEYKSVKLYSKCLSGSTYLTINDFNNLYPELTKQISGTTSIFFATSSLPVRGPRLILNSQTQDQFYNKYLKENGFTLKNLYTPEKVLEDQGVNFKYVDFATTQSIKFEDNTNLIIDGYPMKSGQRLLVKDQVTVAKFTLNDANIDNYFKNTVTVSNYYPLNDEGQSNFYYYNNENGVYLYNGVKLTKESDLSTYNGAYKFSVYVRDGLLNRGKEYHLERTNIGYYPVDGYPVEFIERKNWVLRHRIDYNNIYDLNFYDVTYHGTQTVFSDLEQSNYYIPQRAISVGEFGAIMNTQDKATQNGTYSYSNLIRNKFKVTLNSIVTCTKNYWICGNEGTLLKVDKITFDIEKMKLNEDLDLMSVSFYGDRYGWAVGKFNTIYYTRDFGINWIKLKIDAFEKYSHNRVVHLDENRVYVGGEAGSFIEFTWIDGIWSAYDRVVSKQINEYDEFILSEDITDMSNTKWINIRPFTFSRNRDIVFPDTFVFNHEITTVDQPGNYRVFFNTSVNSSYFSGTNFTNSYLFIGFSVSNTSGFQFKNPGVDVAINDIAYNTPNLNFGIWNKGQNANNNDAPPNVTVANRTTFNPFQRLGRGGNNATFSLPLDINGNIIDDVYTLDVNMRWSYNHITNATGSLSSTWSRYQFRTINGDLIFMSTNNKGLICYDINNSLSTYTNKFIYLSFTQTSADVKTVERIKGSQDVFVGADKLYKFKITDIVNNLVPNINESLITISQSESIYVNKLRSFRSEGGNNWLGPTFSLLLVGNNGLNRYLNTTNGPSQPTFSNPLDPTFNSRFRSRFLILDYDVASKVNFFTDDGTYRLPATASFDRSLFTVSNATLNMGSTTGQVSWIDYSRDSQKTFQYLSGFSDINSVYYSTTFSYRFGSSDYIVSGNLIGISQSSFQTTSAGRATIAPHLASPTASKIIANARTLPTSNWTTNFQLILNEDLGAVVKRYVSLGPFNVESSDVGDVIQIKSDVVDAKFVVNRIAYYNGGALVTTKPVSVSGTLFEILFFYSTFNSAITSELTSPTANVSIRNLNKYNSSEDFISKVNDHPIGEVYNFTFSGKNVVVTPLFNEKSSYYNLQAYFRAGTTSTTMQYESTFLDFGYTPIYNLYSYLNRIDPIAFTGSKTFSAMGTFSVTGTNVAGQVGWTRDRAFFSNAQVGQGTESNLLKFGENLKFQWDSLLLNTFVDLTAKGQSQDFTSNQLLIVDKFVEPARFINTFTPAVTFITGTAYVIAFNQPLPQGPQLVSRYDFRPRMGILQISNDLRLLDNIHKPIANKTVQAGFSFQDRQMKITNKFPTDSYLKILVNDYDIRQNISAILYTDQKYNLATNILNVSRENIINVDYQVQAGTNKLYARNPTNGALQIRGGFTQSVKIGDMVYLGRSFSAALNRRYGWTTVQSYNNVLPGGVILNVDLPASGLNDFGSKLTYYTTDPFFNYQPIDVFKSGTDLKVQRSVEIFPENTIQFGNTYSLVNVDLAKYKFEFLDGLSLEEVFNNHHWMLEAEVSNVKLGKNPNTNTLIWYSGIWRCGRWFDATWISGMWLSGDWYGGTWNSLPVKNNKIFDDSLTNEQDPKFSRWYSGRWFDGTWSGGTWYGGRRYAGDWNSGLWYNGIWNDGNWNNGLFTGGIWIQGKWNAGKFNCDSKPAYWLDGVFNSGDFENGMWYNGQFGNDQSLPARFGTRSTNNRTSTWHGGRWINGDFHSQLNLDSVTKLPKVSKIHKYSIWRTGLWSNGNFYGGVAYNIDFRGGIWHGGILDEIQIIGIDKMKINTSAGEVEDTPPTNKIYINGIFKFNPGDEIWIIDNKKGTTFSVLGSDEFPTVYRINQIEEDSENEITGLFLNYRSSLIDEPLNATLGNAAFVTYSVQFNNIGDMGIRAVSKFTDARWRSGLWLNGYFKGGQFDGGIWYNGVFDGDWGN